MCPQNTADELRRRRANAREAAAATTPLPARPPRGAVSSIRSFDDAVRWMTSLPKSGESVRWSIRRVLIVTILRSKPYGGDIPSSRVNIEVPVLCAKLEWRHKNPTAGVTGETL